MTFLRCAAGCTLHDHITNEDMGEVDTVYSFGEFIEDCRCVNVPGHSVCFARTVHSLQVRVLMHSTWQNKCKSAKEDGTRLD